MKQIRRALALILVLFLTAVSIPLQALSESSYSVDHTYLDIYLRVFTGSNDPSWVGHYDLQINGMIRFRGKTFQDPCFSYGAGSILYIFSAADTPKIYKSRQYESCRMYTAHFKIKNVSRLGAFLSYLEENLASCTAASKCRNAYRCKFRSSSPFSRYSARTVNCFTAAAYWLKGFGNGTLWKIYKNAYKNGPSYLPAPFVSKYHSRLKPVK